MTPVARRRALLDWYRRHARDLPWRRTRDPYRILVSEVMLQQTQVDRVLPFYHRFLQRFPDERALARAPREQLHRHWQGLGYPSRVERLQAAVRLVLDEHGGCWPQEVAGLQALPGIGPYTAAAVACFAFARPVALVDTNVARVYTRRDELPLPLDRTALWHHAEQELARRSPVRYNNALMELGAVICTARSPRCGVCPWRRICAARADAERHALSANPLKVASRRDRYGVQVIDRSRPRLHIVLALVHHAGRYLVARRPIALHQGGCWELPGGKRERGEDDRQALARELREECDLELLSARPFVTWTHDYGDRYCTFHVYRCHVYHPEQARPLASDGLDWVHPQDFLRLRFPPANGPVQERMRAYHRLGASSGGPA